MAEPGALGKALSWPETSRNAQPPPRSDWSAGAGACCIQLPALTRAEPPCAAPIGSRICVPLALGRSRRQYRRELGRYTYTDEAENLVGRAIRDLTTIKDVFSQSVVHPDDRAGYVAAYGVAGAVVRRPTRNTESLHPVSGIRHIREIAEKHFNAAGRLTVVAGTSKTSPIRARRNWRIGAARPCCAASTAW